MGDKAYVTFFLAGGEVGEVAFVEFAERLVGGFGFAHVVE